MLENGTWTLTSTGPVADGTLTATATDINGEVGTDTAGYTDNVVPVVAITEPVTQNTNGTLTVSGTGEAGASVVVKAIDGSTVGTATVLENGTWTLTSATPVKEGQLTATATDINGNEKSASPPRKLPHAVSPPGVVPPTSSHSPKLFNQ